MSTHAKLSPSSAYRWLACPGSVREEAKYPEPPSGPGAVDGPQSHTLLEHCIKGNGDPIKMVGVKMKDHEGEFVVDRSRAERVQVALDYIRTRAGFLGTVRAETRVALKPERGIAVLSLGRKDAVKPGMPFEIFRDDKPIAKVLITEVRNSVCGAIVQELADNTDPVRVGDRGRAETVAPSF